MSSNYWSSTTNSNNTDNAWHVNFNNGNVNNNNKSNSYYVRAVRSGKCSLLSFESVYRAYLDCRKRKRGTINGIRFEFESLDNLFDLALGLQQGTYRPTRSVCFVTTTPKLREIFAADFKDRVVHHLLVRELEKIWEPCLIHDSYASRKGKGTHGAVKRLREFMLKITKNGKVPAWMVQLDIRSFFMSIDKDLLFQIFENRLLRQKDPQSFAMLYLLHRIIYHSCSRDYVFRGNPAVLAKVPEHKSLIKIEENKGLPIGNLTSQFFANVYLNVLDLFIKKQLKCRYYVRYVDDFVLLSGKREELEQWVMRISSFLEKKLLLKLKGGWRIKRVSEGADFLGYIVRPKYVLVRNRVVNNMKSKLEVFKSNMMLPVKNGRGQTIIKMKMDPDSTACLMQSLASYLGHFKHANSYNLIKMLFLNNKWLHEYFFIKGFKLMRKFFFKGEFRSFRSQVGFFRARLKGVVLMFHVGSFIEMYGYDALNTGKSMGLKIQSGKRGMAHVAGLPLRFEKPVIAKILNIGKEVAVIREAGAGRFVKQRHISELYLIREWD